MLAQPNTRHFLSPFWICCESLHETFYRLRAFMQRLRNTQKSMYGLKCVPLILKIRLVRTPFHTAVSRKLALATTRRRCDGVPMLLLNRRAPAACFQIACKRRNSDHWFTHAHSARGSPPPQSELNARFDYTNGSLRFLGSFVLSRLCALCVPLVDFVLIFGWPLVQTLHELLWNASSLTVFFGGVLHSLLNFGASIVNCFRMWWFESCLRLMFMALKRLNYLLIRSLLEFVIHCLQSISFASGGHFCSCIYSTCTFPNSGFTILFNFFALNCFANKIVWEEAKRSKLGYCASACWFQVNFCAPNVFAAYESHSGMIFGATLCSRQRFPIILNFERLSLIEKGAEHVVNFCLQHQMFPVDKINEHL